MEITALRKPTHDEIVDIISRIARLKKDRIKLESKLRTDLGLDSLLSLELLVTLEEQYGLVIEQDAASQFQTLQDLIDHVGR